MSDRTLLTVSAALFFVAACAGHLADMWPFVIIASVACILTLCGLAWKVCR